MYSSVLCFYQNNQYKWQKNDCRVSDSDVIISHWIINDGMSSFMKIDYDISKMIICCFWCWKRNSKKMASVMWSERNSLDIDLDINIPLTFDTLRSRDMKCWIDQLWYWSWRGLVLSSASITTSLWIRGLTRSDLHHN